jgi:hypothetical protein
LRSSGGSRLAKRSKPFNPIRTPSCDSPPADLEHRQREASWVAPDEQVRREEQKVWQAARDAAWAEYKATDPVYLRVEEHVAEGRLGGSKGWFSHGYCYEGWCPHFTEKDERVCHTSVESLSDGTTLTVELEWGRVVAPVKLVVFKGSEKGEVFWFERSVEGINSAVEHVLSLLK